MMYSPDEISAARREALRLNLQAPLLFWCAPPETLVRICNGFGPESAHRALRAVLSFLYRHYAVAAMIHDCRYEESDGSQEKRAAADLEFLLNALTLWRSRFGQMRFFRLQAWKEYLLLKTAACALRLFGTPAWSAAFRKSGGAVHVEL